MEADQQLVDAAVERAYELAGREGQRGLLRRARLAFKGGHDPEDLDELARVAREDMHVLVIAQHRVWDRYRDPTARRAVKMLQEARARLLERQQ
jgi:hypothetical protein